jgi:hypothetical protein
MRNLRWVALFTGVLLAAGFRITDQERAAPGAREAPRVTYSCNVPYDAVFSDDTDFNRQMGFDIYSWNAFIALNWPAETSTKGEAPCNLQNGVARDCDKPLPRGDYGPTVWETYKSDSAVFQGDEKGAIAPVSWNCPLEPLPGCDSIEAVDAAAARLPTLRMIIKDSNSAHAFLQAKTFAPLIDQNGSLVRYEMRMNRDEFEFIDANKLWDSNHHTADVSFQPVGSVENQTVGPIEVKAAWKVLTEKDNRERFHVRPVEIAWPNPAKKGKYLCKQYTMGLVGLHIAHKTHHAPQWIWSTFEHVDNYSGANPSFANPNCDAANCPPNVPPDTPKDGWNGDPRIQWNPPTQVALTDGSVATVRPEATQINAEVRQKLAELGSVWQYYELVSTQWPTVPYINDKPAPVYTKATLTSQGAGQFPHELGNSTMETYLIGPEDPSDPESDRNSSSCMACHNLALIGKPDPVTRKKKFADFSYLLRGAYPAAASRSLSQELQQELGRAFHRDVSKDGQRTKAVRRTK